MSARDQFSEYFIRGSEESKPVAKNAGVNVIYFTNKCNLNCTYCYEDLPGRPPQVITREQIRETVDSVLERENDPKVQTLFVLFGGEATLEWENVNYLMEYAYARKKFIHFNLETNGIKFLSDKFLHEFKENYFYKHGHMTIDISFDGVGNKERVFHNGQESTGSMLKIFKRLNEVGIRFRIRYTIHNLNIKNAYEDIKRIIKTFGPQRVITSVAWSTLSQEEVNSLRTLRDLLRDDWINKSVTTPVCELFCDMCNGCDDRKEIKTYFSDEGNVTTYGNYENTPKFHDFKEKVETK
jgi:sulfatase maturation enzyme AslB (radical SAM superfamily)